MESLQVGESKGVGGWRREGDREGIYGGWGSQRVRERAWVGESLTAGEADRGAGAAGGAAVIERQVC